MPVVQDSMLSNVLFGSIDTNFYDEKHIPNICRSLSWLYALFKFLKVSSLKQCMHRNKVLFTCV